MYKAVTSRAKIDELQKMLINYFKTHGEVEIIRNCNVVHSGRSFKNVLLYWSNKYNLWFFPRETSRNCYWNAFGLGNSKSNNNLGIDVEINFSYDGTSRRIGGLLFKDENSNYFVGHRGKIKPSKKHFWNEYKYKQVEVYMDNKGNEKVAYVGKINSNLFLRSLKEFIVEVKRIKNIEYHT